MNDEYDLAYSKAKPNRFVLGAMRPEYDFGTMRGVVRAKYAGRAKTTVRSVRLDPDIAAAFPSEAAVNAALREYLRTHPKPDPAPTETGV